MAVQITAKVRLNDEGKTDVIVRKVLTDDETGRVLQVMGLTREGYWALKGELEEYPPDCYLEVEMTDQSKAAKAVKTMIKRIQDDPRVTYLIGPFTQTYDDVTDAFAEQLGRDPDEFREEFEKTLKSEPWPMVERKIA
jgi:hypothetical protein